MGASVIEQIYLPNCLCASGIKPTKFQISKEDWVFKLARSTYAQWPPGITANAPGHHRECPRASPRTPLGITANGPGHHREQPQSLSPGSFHEHPSPHHSPEPCSSTPAPTR